MSKAPVAPPKNRKTPVSVRLSRSLESWRTRVVAGIFCVVACLIGWLLYSTVVGDSGLVSNREVPGWTQEQVGESMSRARRIIHALGEYYHDHREYPSSLNAISPKYLAVVEPPTTGGKRWKYFSYNQNSAFYLSFSSGRDNTRAMSYASSRSPAWGRGENWSRVSVDEN